MNNKTTLKSIFYDRIKSLYGEDMEYTDDVYEVVSPSSTTQSIDVFLKKIMEDLKSEDANPAEVINKYDSILGKITEYNSEYRILCDIWNGIKTSVGDSVFKASDVEKMIVKKEITKAAIRMQALKNFTYIAADYDGEIRILLPSVSEWTAIYLSGLLSGPLSVMERISIVISEARPKQPTNVMDTISRLMENIGAENPFRKIVVVPDNVAHNMLSRGEINLILYGASRVLTYNGMPHWITNSCGTEATLLIANEHQIDVHLICPTEKYEEVLKNKDGNPTYTMNYIDEPGTFDVCLNEHSWEMEKRNSRRDFSKLYNGNMLIVNEKESFHVTEEAPSIIVKDAQNEGMSVIK